MLRIPFLVAIALAVAFGGGTLTAIWALRATVGFGAIALGPWVAFPAAQTEAADPYAKAHRARDGDLLLGSAEGLSFRAATDSEGRRLTGACDYEITGMTPPARFWTLHPVSPDSRRIAPARGLPGSLNSWTVLRRGDGSFTITVSAKARPGNWLSVATEGGFDLILTLLDTPTAGSSGVLDLTMPGIARRDCKNA